MLSSSAYCFLLTPVLCEDDEVEDVYCAVSVQVLSGRDAALAELEDDALCVSDIYFSVCVEVSWFHCCAYCESILVVGAFDAGGCAAADVSCVCVSVHKCCAEVA